MNPHYVLLHTSFNAESKKIVIQQVLSLYWFWLLGGNYNSDVRITTMKTGHKQVILVYQYLKESRSSPETTDSPSLTQNYWAQPRKQRRWRNNELLSVLVNIILAPSFKGNSFQMPKFNTFRFSKFIDITFFFSVSKFACQSQANTHYQLNCSCISCRK